METGGAWFRVVERSWATGRSVWPLHAAVIVVRCVDSCVALPANLRMYLLSKTQRLKDSKTPTWTYARLILQHVP